jgi:hypothetical protein
MRPLGIGLCAHRPHSPPRQTHLIPEDWEIASASAGLPGLPVAAGVLNRHTVTNVGNQELAEDPSVTCAVTTRHIWRHNSTILKIGWQRRFTW